MYPWTLEKIPTLICSNLKMTSSYYSPGSWTGNTCLPRQVHHPQGHLSIQVLMKLPLITLWNTLLISRMSILLAAKIAQKFFYLRTLFLTINIFHYHFGAYPGLNRGCLCQLAGMSILLAAKIARTITHWHTLAGKAFLMMAKFVWSYNLPWCWTQNLGTFSQMPYQLGQLSIHMAVEKWYLLQYLSIIIDI